MRVLRAHSPDGIAFVDMPIGPCWRLNCNLFQIMIIKRLAIAIFGPRTRRGTRVPITPEFGVRLILREGDKLVRRNPQGEVEVTTILRGRERGA
jgi:hypothetical protein